MKMEKIYQSISKGLSILIALSLLSGCSTLSRSKEIKPSIKEIPVPQKCILPEIPRPDLEKIEISDTPEKKLEKLIQNYGRLKYEVEVLRQVMKLCQ